MTGREKIEAAFERGGTAELPAVICYEGIFIRDHWDRLAAEPWWVPYGPDLERRVAVGREVMRKIGQDWFVLPGCPSRREREDIAVEVRDDGVFRVDRRTGEEVRMDEPQVGGWWAKGTSPAHVTPPSGPGSIEEIDRHLGPDTQFDAQPFQASGRCDLARRMLEGLGAEKFPIVHTNTPLWTCYGLWGFEGMMTRVAERADLVAHACDRFLAQSIQRAEAGAALGAKGIWLEECMTDMVSPAAFEALNLPRLRRLVEEIRRLGMRSIYYYCGNPAGKWDLLLAAGADALSLEEGKKGFEIDIEEVVERVGGRCTVLGNLDAVGVLQNGTEGQLRAEIQRQLAAGRKNGSRFIMSLGSPVTPDTPVERVRRYCDLVHELGRN
ncbi:MAG TPA: uroporphyrinogen decarboxylase family protein [Phycisphaerae bacterium]|nr:uroporphyrinogen decarboxylase family protein [Phycisphaerae bacterium]